MKKIFKVFILVLLMAFFSSAAAPAKEKAETLFSEIVAAVEKKDYDNAIKKLFVFEREFPHPLWENRAVYLLGYCHYKKGDIERALDFYTKSMQTYTKLRDYAHYQVASILGEKKEYEKQIESLKDFLKLHNESRLRSQALFDMGNAYFQLKKYGEAYPLYERFSREYPEDDKITTVLYRQAFSLEQTGHYKEAFPLYQKIFIDFPDDSLAGSAFSRMKEIRERFQYPLRLYTTKQRYIRAEKLARTEKSRDAIREFRILSGIRGEIGEDSLFSLASLYAKMRKRDNAVKTFEWFIKKYPSSPRIAEAYYGIGKIYWNIGPMSQSKLYLKRLIRSYPRSEWSEAGLFILARIDEEEKSYEEAIDQYTRLMKNFPGGKFYREAQWKRGWVNYLSGAYKDAYQDFEKVLEDTSLERDVRVKLLYWLGRSAEKRDEKEEAVSIYKKLYQDYPFTYYGYAAEKRLEKVFSNGEALSAVPSSLKSVSLTQRDIVDSPPLNERERYHYEKIKELNELGLMEDASKEIDFLLNGFPTTFRHIFLTGKLYFESKAFLDSIKRLNLIYAALSHEEIKNLPREFWEIYYPRDLLPLITPHSRNRQLDPYLVLSIIRQESAFDPEAVSSAGAVGLMQLLPNTARTVSQKLDMKRFRRTMLFEPDINVMLGTKYFSDLLKRYHGDVVFALAGYNAGKGRVDKWMETNAIDDIEVFIEQIPYNETRGYVKRILRNYNNYKAIYEKG
jgi:soluble lytic murein transglycosylase